MKLQFIAEDWQTIPYHLYGKYIDRAASIIQNAPIDKNAKDQGQVPFGKLLSPQLKQELNANWQDFTKANPKTPIGTGPYVVSKVTANEMLLKKNPYYYGSSKVKFKEISLVNVPDLNQQYALLKAGKLDRFDLTQPKDILESILSANKNLVHYIYHAPASVGFMFNLAHKPFDNQVFRQAIIYALNRKSIREVANYYAHETDVSATGILPSAVNNWISSDVLSKFTKYPYDPNKAAQLLQSIGWNKGSDGIWRDKNGKSYQFTAAANASWVFGVNAGEVVAEQLTQFGLPTKFQAVDPSIFYQKASSGNGAYDLSFDFVDITWGFGFPWYSEKNMYWGSPEQEAHLPQTSNGEANLELTGFDGQKVNPSQLLNEIPYMTNATERTHAIEEIAYVTNEDAWAVNLFQNVSGTWLNMATVGGVPWQSAIEKYHRNLPIPPNNQAERIAETNEGFAGHQWLVDGTYYPN